MVGRLVFLVSAVAALSFSACGGDDDDGGVDCSMSTVTYTNFGESFFSNHCLECHDSAKSGSDRNDAPDDVNFNSLEMVEMHSSRVRARAGTGSSMPPSSAGSTPSQSERDMLAEWIECGLPE